MYLCGLKSDYNMKIRNLLFAAILAMVTFAGFSVKAQDSVFSYTYQGTTLYYIIDTNQQARVVPPLYPSVHWNADSTESQSWYGYSKPQGAVVVPDTVMFGGGHYPVTGLLKYAFYRCDSVTSVTLPASVTYLGNDAFTRCSLETVSMPGVTFMGEGCFYYAGSLTSVDIPAGVTFVPEWGFDHCASLQSVTLHNGTTAIGKCAFRWCQNLSSVTFPESLNTIGIYAFNKCTSLQSVTLPNSLTSIGTGAFSECSNLLSITFSNSLTNIGDNAFNACTSLQSVTFPNSLTSIGTSAFSDCSGLQSVTFPNSLTNLGEFAFYGCSSLQSVDIPGSVSVIGAFVFALCSSLTTVTLHEGTEILGNCAFRECPSLTSINYPSTLKEIGTHVFQFDNELATPVILPEGLTHLGELAYGDCSSIVSASLPGSLGEISGQVFYGCTSLAKVTIEEGIMAIGALAFLLCDNLDTLIVKCVIPPDLGSYSDYVFSDFNVTVVVPCGSEQLYRNYAVWENFSEIIGDCGDDISEYELPSVNIRVENARIVVEGAEGETVRVFDITGRLVRNESLSAGVYLVQIGNRPAEKVVVYPNM